MTKAETIFKKIIKDNFHHTLKPLGFKKKGNNFYLQGSDLGQIINIQKSIYGDKTHISFTINTGIFIPEYFLAYYTYTTEIPEYPTEPICAVRQRIGELRGEKDKWYEIDGDTDEQTLLAQIQEDLNDFILPYFAKTSTRALLIQILDTLQFHLPILGKLMLYGGLKDMERARKEYQAVLQKNSDSNIISRAKELAIKYGIL